MEILIAEDDEDNAFAYREALKERKHFVTITNNGQDCVNAYKKGLGRLAKGGRESTSTNPPLPFDVVILDYMMPKKDGLQVAKEIFSVRPKQRVIFASAYIKDTVEEPVRELEQVVEVMQKPFDVNALIDSIEDKQISEGLNTLMPILTKIKRGKGGRLDPTQDEIRDLFEGLRKIQKGRTF